MASSQSYLAYLCRQLGVSNGHLSSTLHPFGQMANPAPQDESHDIVFGVNAPCVTSAWILIFTDRT